MTKIWFNHWFSTAYYIIKMIKKDFSDAVIVGTNSQEKSLISDACDEWYIEPSLKGEEYIDFCLTFCLDHDISIFVPRREMINISKNKTKFEAIGVKVMVDDYSRIDLLNHKDQAYSFLLSQGVSSIPEYYVVKNIKEFLDAYEKLSINYKEVCFKFVHDEGGKSFRLIDNTRKGYQALFKKQNTRMTLDDVVEALSEVDEFSPIMVMPNLPGDEVSVDCLKTEQGLIMLPRIKSSARLERMSYDKTLLNMTKEVYDKVELECPCNIQFKYLDGKLYFLEINTRMSGGIHMSCLASGVNIPYLAIKKLLGESVSWDINMEECYITHVEKPIILR